MTTALPKNIQIQHLNISKKKSPKNQKITEKPEGWILTSNFIPQIFDLLQGARLTSIKSQSFEEMPLQGAPGRPGVMPRMHPGVEKRYPGHIYIMVDFCLGYSYVMVDF